MTEEGEGLYKTNVRVLIRYIYIQEFQGKIENAETRRLNISVDAMTGIMYSPYRKLKGCKLEDGSCTDRVSTIIWDNPVRKICEDIRRSQLGPSTTIQILHDPNGRKILKAEKLKMYFEERVKTPKEIRNCSLDGEIISTSNGIQIALENCTSSSTTESIKEMLRKGKPSKEAGRSYRYITYFMDFLEQNLVEYIKKEMEANELRECEQSRKELEMLKMMARYDPTKVMSTITGTEVDAIYRNGIIHQVKCKNSTAIIEKSLLTRGGKRAVRPTARITDADDTGLRVQWAYGNTWTSKITLRNRDTHEKTVESFMINDRVYSYKGGKLVVNATKVEMIRLHSGVAALTYHEVDFEGATGLEGEAEEGEQETQATEELGNVIEQEGSDIRLTGPSEIEEWSKDETHSTGWYIAHLIWGLLGGVAGACWPVVLVCVLIRYKRKKAGDRPSRKEPEKRKCGTFSRNKSGRRTRTIGYYHG